MPSPPAVVAAAVLVIAIVAVAIAAIRAPSPPAVVAAAVLVIAVVAVGGGGGGCRLGANEGELLGPEEGCSNGIELGLWDCGRRRRDGGGGGSGGGIFTGCRGDAFD